MDKDIPFEQPASTKLQRTTITYHVPKDSKTAVWDFSLKTGRPRGRGNSKDDNPDGKKDKFKAKGLHGSFKVSLDYHPALLMFKIRYDLIDQYLDKGTTKEAMFNYMDAIWEELFEALKSATQSEKGQLDKWEELPVSFRWWIVRTYYLTIHTKEARDKFGKRYPQRQSIAVNYMPKKALDNDFAKLGATLITLFFSCFYRLC